MMKTPFWGRRHIIEITDKKKVSHYKNLFLFSLDIWKVCLYCGSCSQTAPHGKER